MQMTAQNNGRRKKSPTDSETLGKVTVNAQKVLDTLFSGSPSEQLTAVSLAGSSGAPLLLRAILWKHAEGNSVLSEAVESALEPHFAKIQNLLWREVGSPIRAVRIASLHALKKVTLMKDVGKFFPILDDYDLSVREQAKQAVREVVQREVRRFQEIQSLQQRHALLSKAHRDFLALAISSKLKQQFAAEMLMSLDLRSLIVLVITRSWIPSEALTSETIYDPKKCQFYYDAN